MQFDDWFAELWGYTPFPWQSELAECAEWPTSIAAPTGSGKTAAIDVWLWRRIQGRAPRRLWYVVDRRALVDGAWERARELVSRAGADCDVVRLRGGVFEERPLLDPSRDAIICSTVDQFGSRLLFRGYGLGRTGRVMHAALAGSDSLLLLDEAHISQPLLDTVQAAQRYGADVTAIPMTATPQSPGDRPLKLNDGDWTDPLLGRRLRAKKLVSLTSSKLEVEALKLRKAGAKSIAVWCNTVQRAVETAAALEGRGKTVLLTGRQRLHDRDSLLAEWGPKLTSGAIESPAVFVVSTQVLEVGIDWDFDAMVSECASIDALRQRLGRLDRIGKRGETEAVVLKPPAKPVVYGEAAKATWAWLNESAVDGKVDFGIEAQQGWAVPGGCSMPHNQAPMLLQCHIDAWALTSENSRLPVALWLHGSDEVSDCRILWRGDLKDGGDDWVERASALPPAIGETASVPVRAVAAAGLGRVLYWRGADESYVGDANDVRPGDTLVIPETAGGFELACLPMPLVPDIAEVVQDAVRLTSESAPEGVDIEEATAEEVLAAMPASIRKRLGQIPDIRSYPGGWVFAASLRSPSLQARAKDDLAGHSRKVSELASQIAGKVAANQRGDLALAARWHDAGKADPRFQAWLAGGVWDGQVLLAKSGQSWSQIMSARNASGYPLGARHEFLSAALFSESSVSATGDDLDLVLHLIEAHHGWARPSYPWPKFNEPLEFESSLFGEQCQARTDQSVADENRLWTLVDRYGHWRLASLLGILMYADQKVSSE